MPNTFTYLDNNSTTRISDGVREAMLPFLGNHFGNPSNDTAIGRHAKKAIEEARSVIASALDCAPTEVLFTSGGSEGNSIALNSYIHFSKPGKMIITTNVEHDSIRMYLKSIAQEFNVFAMPVDSAGRLSANSINDIDCSTVGFCTVMLVNNEIGNIYPVSEIVANIKKGNDVALAHCDAVQAFGKFRFSVKELGVDYLTISGHKIHAPKGVGALYVRKEAHFTPLIYGHQENQNRGGTENVASIVGFGQAVKEAAIELDKRNSRIAELRDDLERRILKSIPDAGINGDVSSRVSNTSNLYFPQVDSLKLLLQLEMRGIFASIGAACNGGKPQDSHVLEAINCPFPQSSIRVSLSEQTDEFDVDYFVTNCVEAVQSIKGGN